MKIEITKPIKINKHDRVIGEKLEVNEIEAEILIRKGFAIEVKVQEEKPIKKRKRRTKAEIEAEKNKGNV